MKAVVSSFMPSGAVSQGGMASGLGLTSRMVVRVTVYQKSSSSGRHGALLKLGSLGHVLHRCRAITQRLVQPHLFRQEPGGSGAVEMAHFVEDVGIGSGANFQHTNAPLEG